MVKEPALSLRPPSWLAVFGLILAVLLVFANGIAAPFLFDDDGSIAHNASVHSLGTGMFVPLAKPGDTAQGRPVLNATLALSYAMGGGAPWAFHLGNILIHLAATLVLFGILRRTLRKIRLGSLASQADSMAFMIALLWAIHPLQTESVTYIIQRAESLAGLLYLTTLYAFLRGENKPEWLAVSVFTCALGMAAKETMVTAPFLVLAYDLWFVGGSLKTALRKRWKYYLPLFATLGILVACVASTGWNRGGTIGINVNVAWWVYAAAQARAVLVYLKLSLWPQPLVFDYGPQWMHSFAEFAPWAAGVVVLLALLVVGWRKRTAWGFALFWFLLILSPSSSIVPGNRQTLAEHRMYLPLAAVVAVLVVFLLKKLDRLGWPILLLFAVVLATGSAARNMTYHSVVSLYADTAEKVPNNPYALNNYGDALFKAGLIAESRREFEKALQLYPVYSEARGNLGAVELKLGKTELAIKDLKQSLVANPRAAELEENLGDAYLKLGRRTEAIAALRHVVEIDPEFAEAHFNLANALAEDHQSEAALAEYAEGARLAPDRPQFQNNYAAALAKAGKIDEAVAAFRQAASLAPDNPGIWVNLGNTLAGAGRWSAAAAAYQEAVNLDPDSAANQKLLSEAKNMQGISGK